MKVDQIAIEGFILLKPNEGRRYNLGSMKAIFKADETETNEQYAVSEWWLEPNSHGPGPHCHEDNDEIIYVLEGTI
ncbi:MAG: cupin domain-containing protein, partial [Methylotenera sp.]|nr:cupin domain-containing protein [Flavobacterium sp.]